MVRPMSHIDPLNLHEQERADAERRERDKLAATNADNDLKWLMDQKRGRRIVWRQLEATGIYRSSFNHSGSVMAFNEGARNVGLKLLADVTRVSPHGYALMIEEHTKQ